MSDAHQRGPVTRLAPPGSYEIELRMLCVRDHVPGLRALVAEWALGENHRPDFVDDARLAVDEVCSVVMANCEPTDPLTARLLVDPEGIRIQAWAPARRAPLVGGLSLRVLEALADSLDVRAGERDREQVLMLTFGRARRRAGPP